MSTHTHLDKELERRLLLIETEETANPIHAKLSGKSITLFLTVVLGITVVSWVVAVL